MGTNEYVERVAKMAETAKKIDGVAIIGLGESSPQKAITHVRLLRKLVDVSHLWFAWPHVEPVSGNLGDPSVFVSVACAIRRDSARAVHPTRPGQVVIPLQGITAITVNASPRERARMRRERISAIFERDGAFLVEMPYDIVAKVRHEGPR